MSNENEKYFLVRDLGQENLLISEFDNITKALRQYNKYKLDVRSQNNKIAWYEGIALIKGKVIKIKNIEFEDGMQEYYE